MVRTLQRMPKAVIAPHAGYVYSGPVAGHAFAALGAGASDIRRAVVVGPRTSCRSAASRCRAPSAFRTPLGEVPLDHDAIEALRDLPQVKLADVPHEPEHALEVELPFLQAVLGDFALVPLLVGEATAGEVAQVLERLWGGPETLIVISSDLSHYEPYGACQASTTRRPRRRSSASMWRPSGRAMPAASCRSAACSWRRLDAACASPAWTCAIPATPPARRTRWSATAPGRFTRLDERPAMSVRLFAGASGFSYKPWKGPFYPEGLPDAEMLGYYAARLSAVEINNTFYRLPKAKMLEDWAAQTPDGFRFVLKASRRITHMQRLKDVGELVGYLFETAGVLGPKLGPLLFQLPPHLKKDLDRLRAFLDLVPADRRVALEFRNASWFEDDVFEALRAHDAALCVAETEPQDKEGGGLTVPLVATASWGYLRLRRENYSDADLEAWAARMRGQGWSEAYVFFKHEDDGTAPKFALRLMQVMGAQTAPA